MVKIREDVNFVPECNTSTEDENISKGKLIKIKEFLPSSKPRIYKKLMKVMPLAKSTHRNLIPGSSKGKDVLRKLKENVFHYPNDWEIFANDIMRKAWREDTRVKELQTKLADKKNIQGKLNGTKFDRLYVGKTPPNGAVFVEDQDPSYFRIIENRPLGQNLSIRNYIKTVRNILKTRVTIGFREDDDLIMETSTNMEFKLLETIQTNLRTYIDIFEDFLFKDHTSAKDTLARSNMVAKEMYDSSEYLKKMTKKKEGVRIGLLKSEVKWDRLKKQKKFLFQLSPLYWRLEHGDNPEENQNNDIFMESFDISIVSNEADLSLEQKLERVLQECRDAGPCELYFTKPSQLLEVFEYIQLQNLNYLLHIEELAIPLKYTENLTEFVMTSLDKVIENLESAADRLQREIVYEETRAAELEKLSMSLINKDFKKLVSSDEILRLYCSVEDIYESALGHNDAGLSVKQMMLEIEKKYNSELFVMDDAPSEIVRRLEIYSFKNQAKRMKLAEIATKQYTELLTLSKQIKQAYLPPFPKPRYKPLMPRSVPPQEYKPPPKPKRVLTEAESDYLEYFTDFCVFDDSPMDFNMDFLNGSKIAKPTIVESDEYSVQTIGPQLNMSL